MLPNDPTRRWEKCKETLSKLLNREIIEQRIDPLRIQEISETAVVLEVPQNLAIDALRRGFAGLIQHAVEDTLGWHPTITFVPEAQVHTPHRRSPAWTSLPPVEMHPSYTFETFVVGSNSQFAHSAARAVADAPGRTRFNPLLIYGGVGLGKTHLLQAIGHRGLSLQPDLRVRFVPAETFLREFLDSLSNNKIDLFKNFYRNEVDLLLMDDIQFLSGRDAVQEEFFHLFNALHQSNRQIVLTSDCPPGELQGLEDRLVSRFQWGLFVDIQPPDRDTREAILRSKAAAENLDLSDEIIAFLAENINSNIRVLEGAIRHLILRANLRKSDITIDLAQEIVDATAQPSSARRVSPDEIMSVVAEHFQVDGESLRREGRGTKEVAKARQVSMYLIKQLIDLSLKSIGNHFGNRDHSTVIHAIRTTEKAMHESSGFKAEIESLLKKFR